MGDPQIRMASEHDLGVLREIAESTFCATFSADNRPVDMDAYLAEAFSEAQVRRELQDPASTFFLAWRDPDQPPGQPPIGYAKLRAGEAHPSVEGPAPIEIERIYVTADAIGLGVGSALMKTLLSSADAADHETIWLGVWERNQHAIAFYRRWGFEVVGAHTFRLGSDPQNDLIMARRVEDDPRSLAASGTG